MRGTRLLLWRAIRQRIEFKTSCLREATNLPERTIDTYVETLLDHGYLEQTEQACESYRLVRDTGLYPPEVRAGRIVDCNLNPELRDKRSKLWAALRICRRFDCAQLAAITQQNYGAISRYLKFLREAGYLRVVQPHQSGKVGGRIVYQLVRDPGPLPPMCRQDGTLFDPNQTTKHK